MEFKGDTTDCARKAFCVDIGTEWNLKIAAPIALFPVMLVDIGTEWNLKYAGTYMPCEYDRVDIGTEWNLKWKWGQDRGTT